MRKILEHMSRNRAHTKPQPSLRTGNISSLRSQGGSYATEARFARKGGPMQQKLASLALGALIAPPQTPPKTPPCFSPSADMLAMPLAQPSTTRATPFPVVSPPQSPPPPQKTYRSVKIRYKKKYRIGVAKINLASIISDLYDAERC